MKTILLTFHGKSLWPSINGYFRCNSIATFLKVSAFSLNFLFWRPKSVDEAILFFIRQKLPSTVLANYEIFEGRGRLAEKKMALYKNTTLKVFLFLGLVLSASCYRIVVEHQRLEANRFESEAAGGELQTPGQNAGVSASAAILKTPGKIGEVTKTAIKVGFARCLCLW